jgi:outer membrane protein assembly factor BamB
MVDGGSNTLTWTPQRGESQIVAAFPNPTELASPNAYDAVPTCVAPTANGVVVADLNGRIFVVDGSSITVAPETTSAADGAFLVAAGGCASDGHGDVYVSDIFAGSVVKLELSTMTLSWVRPPGTLNFPAGVAIGRHGELYVANNSVCPGFVTPSDPTNPCGGVTGSIVRIDP